MRPTFHLVAAETWATRDPAEPYAAASLADEGFIHCTDGAERLVATANRHYRADPRPFLVLTVDLEATRSPWRFDDEAESYPHVYGPIAPGAIRAVAPIERDSDGRFTGFTATEAAAGDEGAPGPRIVPLTAEAWPALAALFEEGGDPRWCWCMFWRMRGVDFGRTDAGVNREALRSLADRAPAPGLVAFDADGRAIGWISLGPREAFERLERSRVRPRLDDVPVWSVVCFVIARRARHQGLAGRLLEAGVAYAREHGAPALEAYPVDTATGRPTAATLYTGALSTFLRAGFRVAREIDSPGATVARSIVRLDLGAGR